MSTVNTFTRWKLGYASLHNNIWLHTKIYYVYWQVQINNHPSNVCYSYKEFQKGAKKESKQYSNLIAANSVELSLFLLMAREEWYSRYTVGSGLLFGSISAVSCVWSRLLCIHWLSFNLMGSLSDCYEALAKEGFHMAGIPFCLLPSLLSPPFSPHYSCYTGKSKLSSMS